MKEFTNIQNGENMEKYIEGYKEWIDETWDKLDKKLEKTAIKSREKIPYTTVNGVHDNMAEETVFKWTNGFWGGLMWLMYIGTHNDEYKKTAERQEQLLDSAFNDFNRLHHDVGFMWNLTSGMNFRITGNAQSKNRLSYAAAILASRYNISGGFIRAWPDWGTKIKNTGVTIIDSMMNIPLLFRAAEIENDNRYSSIAIAHADMVMKHHIRPDGSVYHVVDHDPYSGVVTGYRKGQGYAEESSWSRGQAWAIYGFVLSYIFTGDTKYLDVAKSVAHYFISNVSMTDYLPLVDFKAPYSPVMYDSTAGVCAACGLIEIAKSVSEYEKKLYIEAAMKLLVSAEKNFCNWDENEDSILQKGTEAYTKGIHIPIIYGDFFFAEAILKLKDNNFLAW